MSEEIKIGDWVKVSDISEEDARHNWHLHRVTGVFQYGVQTIDTSWKYAVHPDDVKVLPRGEYKALIQNKMPSTESFEAGQELNHYQVLGWVEKYGSKSGLQYMIPNGLWVYSENTLNSVIDTQMRYRVAPKKVNDHNDPTTWEKGVAIFRRDREDGAWVLDSFRDYSSHVTYKYRSERGAWIYAKLATPEQVEAWKLINEDL